MILFCAQNAYGSFYQYVDEKGRIHLTNDESKILPEYRESVKMLGDGKTGKKDAEGIGGLTGTGGAGGSGDSSFFGEKESAWLKYKQMGWIKKKLLVARAGFTDIRGVMDDQKFQLVGIAVIFFGLGVLAIVKLKKLSHIMPIITLLVFCYGLVYVSLHIKSTMGRGGNILSALSQNKGEGMAGSEGGIMGSLRKLQNLSTERQEIFRMILEEQ